MEPIFIVLPVVTLLFLVGFEISHRSVFGKHLSEEALDDLLAGELKYYSLTDFSEWNTLLFGWKDNGPLPYLTCGTKSLTSKWSVGGTSSQSGTIPRWSKWSRILDDHRAKLIEENRINMVRQFENPEPDTTAVRQDGVTVETEEARIASPMFTATSEFVRGYTDQYKLDNPGRAAEIINAQVVRYGEDIESYYVEVKYNDGSFEEIPLAEYNSRIPEPISVDALRPQEA